MTTKPGIGDPYYFVDSNIQVSATTWTGKHSDELRYQFHNVFRTRYAAEKAQCRVRFALEFFAPEILDD